MSTTLFYLITENPIYTFFTSLKCEVHPTLKSYLNISLYDVDNYT